MLSSPLFLDFFPVDFWIRNSVYVCVLVCECKCFICTMRVTVPPVCYKMKISRKYSPASCIPLPPVQLSRTAVYAAVHVPVTLLSFSKQMQLLIRVLFLTFSLKIKYLIHIKNRYSHIYLLINFQLLSLPEILYIYNIAERVVSFFFVCFLAFDIRGEWEMKCTDRKKGPCSRSNTLSLFTL
jgi:hypothetical protein